MVSDVRVPASLSAAGIRGGLLPAAGFSALEDLRFALSDREVVRGPCQAALRGCLTGEGRSPALQLVTVR
jgi:hypothetical protein